MGKAGGSHTGKRSSAPVWKADLTLQSLSKGADLIRSVFKIILKKVTGASAAEHLGGKTK